MKKHIEYEDGDGCSYNNENYDNGDDDDYKGLWWLLSNIRHNTFLLLLLLTPSFLVWKPDMEFVTGTTGMPV